MNNDLISVIVPVFNSANTITKCLRSLLYQTYSFLEIIIVYLESSDETLHKIKAFQDKRIKIIIQKDKTGPGGARNLGVAAAQGKWIGFVEADDFIAQDFYEKLLDHAKKYQCDIAQGEIYLNNKLWSAANNQLYTSLKDKYEIIQNGASFDKIFKSDLIHAHDIRFSECVRWEDNPFIIKAFYFANRIITVKDANYFYFPNFNVQEDNYKKKLYQSILPVAEDIINFARKNKHSSTELNILKHCIIRSFANYGINNRKIYLGLMELMDSPFFLRLMYYKARFRDFKKNFKLGKEKK